MVNIFIYNFNVVGSSVVVVCCNCVVIDVFEFGLMIKLILMVVVFFSGKFILISLIIDIIGGYWFFGGYDIYDMYDYGVFMFIGVIIKLSNVGVVYIVMQFDIEFMYNIYCVFGFGNFMQSGFFGEVFGWLCIGCDWCLLEKVIFGYGYGLNVIVLQLVIVYVVFGDGGVLYSFIFIKGGQIEVIVVIELCIVCEIVDMMEIIIQFGGIVVLWVWIVNYLVVVKIGIVYKVQVGGYVKDVYGVVFVGLVLVSNLWLVVVVMIDNLCKGSYYGGFVFGLVFVKVMDGVLCLFDILLDNIGCWYVGGLLQGKNGLIGNKLFDVLNIEEVFVDWVML